jgi:hypothetical protein
MTTQTTTMQTPQETTTAETPVWAIVELMGHVRYGGKVSKDNHFGTAMLRIDVPQADGTFVSQLINPSSLYRLTMCSEELARAAANQGNPRPMSSWEVRHLLPAPEQTPEPDEDYPV